MSGGAVHRHEVVPGAAGGDDGARDVAHSGVAEQTAIQVGRRDRDGGAARALEACGICKETRAIG